jgi:hypothetical protein
MTQMTPRPTTGSAIETVARTSPLLRVLVKPIFHSSDHLVKRDIEHVGDFPQAYRCRVQNAAFDAADVGSVEATLRREFFLRNAGSTTTIGHSRAERSLFEAGGLNLASAPLHQEFSWCYVEAHKPTAYTPHLIGVPGEGLCA